MSTKVRSALSVDSVDRRGFFGFLGRGGLSLGIGSGLLARRNRLARARGGSPPLLGGALMPCAGLPLAALSQGLGSAQGLPGSAPGARTRLYMTAHRDETTIRERGAAHAAARKMIDALVPPKPNEFDSAT